MDKQREAFEAWYSNWASSKWEPSFGEVWDAACEWQAALSHAEGKTAPDYVLDALDNLIHDNYERGYRGAKNRQDDAELIRCALRRSHPAPQVEVPDVPNGEMIQAGEEALERGLKNFPDNMAQVINNIWEDMYEAANAEEPDFGALTEFEKEGISKRAKEEREEREEREGLTASDPDEQSLREAHCQGFVSGEYTGRTGEGNSDDAWAEFISVMRGVQPYSAPDERKNPAPPAMIADCLYQAGYEDAKKERDYNPRACVEWQVAVDAMSEWVSVGDRLPPWGYCLTYRPDAPNGNQIATVQYNPYKGFSGIFLVTHWMPLPAPPEPHQGRGGGDE